MDLISRLKQISDSEYAVFQAKLTPNIDKNLFIGVRVPVLRKFAKEYVKEEESKEFIKQLPHKYYDENMLHGLLISLNKNYDEVICQLDKFLPYVDNWAVCDIMSPKVLVKHKEDLIIQIKKWVKSNKTYTIRFAIEMLMSFYLDKDFKAEYLEIPLSVKSEEYYVNMMLAWFYATALSKQWEATFPLIESKVLQLWVHNMSIQKALESYRITDEQKEILRKLKI